uniref:HD domain-containing protein n=1 Tax=Thermorudis peleae TaxID=1382356 RepID=A0A831TGJ2_9BACT
MRPHGQLSRLARVHWRVGVAGVLPLALLGLLLGQVLPDPAWQVPVFHFYLVSLVSFLALLLALAMTLAASQIDNVRVLFLALAFLGISSIFLVHALTTPGVLVPGANGWVGASARLSLLIGAVMLALSTLEAQPVIQRWILRHRGWIILAAFLLFALYGLVALVSAQGAPASMGSVSGSVTGHGGNHSSGYDAYSPVYGSVTDEAVAQTAAGTSQWRRVLGQVSSRLAGEPAGGLLAGVTLALLGVVGVHYWRAYGRWNGPLVRSMLLSTIFLFQAQVSMAVAPAWHLSWWEYHALLLAAFLTALAGLAREYGERGSLRGVVEGLLLRDTIQHLQREYVEVIAALCSAVEAKDVYTRGHSTRVATLAALIGQELGLPPERLRILYQAGLLHDIGKIGIPDAVLHKPARLTDEEFALIKQHPVRSHEIIRHVRSFAPIVPAVRWHHERLDGSGYPDGLAGDEIPLDARIMAAADVFDALTSLRPYRAPLSLEEALDVLDQEAGTRLDPECVSALRQVVAVRWPVETAATSLPLELEDQPVIA